MANRGYGYQYETSPRKLEPDYERTKVKKKKPVQKKTNPQKKKQNNKNVKAKQKKKFEMSLETKFFLNSMMFFAVIFAMIACQALVEQRYKEKETLKKEYNELLTKSNLSNAISDDTRILASEYGMQTKSATLINLETTDYIESSADRVEMEEEGFFDRIVNWMKDMF